MNREIKFRSYLKDYEMMVNVDYINLYLNEIIVDIGSNQYEFHIGEYELMQFTGLKDKNGKEIYEGDIVTTDLSRPYLIVKYHNGAFMFQCLDEGKTYYDFMNPPIDEEVDRYSWGEVIGNIYENPELLED